MKLNLSIEVETGYPALVVSRVTELLNALAGRADTKTKLLKLTITAHEDIKLQNRLPEPQ